jgi:hypothetical protein
MNEDDLRQYITDIFAGVDYVVASRESGAPEVAWGDTFFYYNPDHSLTPDRRYPFATIVTKDYGDFDRASHLDRPGVFRLNIGVRKDTYRSLFGSQPSPAGEAGIVDTRHDFTALDQLLPHPVYAPQSWVCIVSPSEATMQAVVRPLLTEAYERAVSRHERRAARD